MDGTTQKGRTWDNFFAKASNVPEDCLSEKDKPQIITKTQFRRHLEEYLRKVEQGQKLVITDRGRPFCMVVPVVEDAERCFQELRDTVLKYDAPLEPVE